MPPKERPTGRKRRRHGRRPAPRQQVAAPAYKAPVTAATAATRPISPPATTPSMQQAFSTQHKYITAELRRVGIIIGALIIVLVVLALILR